MFVITRLSNRKVILLFEYFGYSTAELYISMLFLVAEARSLKEGPEEPDLKK